MFLSSMGSLERTEYIVYALFSCEEKLGMNWFRLLSRVHVRNRCHTFEPPTEKEYWTPPIMVGDEQLTLDGRASSEDDAVVSAAEEEEREISPLKVLST